MTATSRARLVTLVLAVVALAAAVLATVPATTPTPTRLATVADTSQFSPGNIISDAVFFDGDAMSAAEIQAFLSVKGSSCRPGNDGTPCLKNFVQDTSARAADGLCSGYSAGSQEPAALIIAKVAQSCGVSPRVLLVILQKEQSLVSTAGGSALYAMRYQKATGFACPDTAACDTTYSGFQNQVYAAARQFQKYAANPTSYGYRAGRTSSVLYNPNAACGSSTVLIQNQATAGLYIYTPYQPNAAALNAGYGSGDNCSAYGNRNFWLYFTDWFGSTQAPGESASLPTGSLEEISTATGNQVRVKGWVVDPDTTAPVSVHVYVDGQGVGAYTADLDRPDVAQALVGFGPRHGYDLMAPVTQGRHTVCVYAINVGAGGVNPQLGCGTVDTSGVPVGNLEQVTVSGGDAVLKGWALDPDSAAPLAVHVYVNGRYVTQFTAADIRGDVAASFPASGSAHGFSGRVPLQPGDNQVCAFAINVPTPGLNPKLGCRVVTLLVDPVGNLESATGAATSLTVVGWALDPETNAPVDVHVYVDGNGAGSFTANGDRPDVAAGWPGSGPAHGFSVTVPVAAGVHQVCVYAINVLQGTSNPQLGCRSVDVGVPPVGRIDVAAVSSYTVQVNGWSFDPDTAASIDVHLYVDGVFSRVVPASAARPDVAAVYPAAGPAHGFQATIPVASGRHEVCAYGINVLGGKGNPLLSCAAVVVDGGRSQPFGQLDGVDVAGGVTVARGWSIDPDAPTAALVTHFYVDGVYRGQTPAGDSRSDVAGAFPGAGPGHGYVGYFLLEPGRHTVCTYAINQGPGQVNPALGCRVVSVP